MMLEKGKSLILAALMLMMGSLASHAQWAVGVSGGWDWNTPTVSKGQLDAALKYISNYK